MRKHRIHCELRIEELEPRIAPNATPAQIANALDLPDSVVATYSGDPVAVQTRTRATTGGLLGFPSGRDEDFLMMSTGVASQIDTVANTSGSQGTDLGPAGEAGDTATVSFTLPVPGLTQTQKLKFDFMFLSEEYPEYVGSQFNDFFTATVNGTNVALDQLGNPISVNNVFFTGEEATGTFFDGRTSLLTASYTVPVGTSSLNIVLSIGDVGDGIYDSGVLLDNFRFETPQVVYLNFDGEAVSIDGKNWTQPAFAPTDIGYAAGTDKAGVVSTLVSQIQADYTGLDISFTTTKPTSGDYATVVIGGDDVPLNGAGNHGLMGQAQSVDIGNRNRNDIAAVFSKEFGLYYAAPPQNEGTDVITQRLSTTISHELGHLLGLRHIDNTHPEDIMRQNEPRDPAGVFDNTLLPLPAAETNNIWLDKAKNQNDQEYLKGVLGVPGAGSVLAPSWNWLDTLLSPWSTLNFGAMTIYDVQVGSAPSAHVSDVGAQVFHFDSLSGSQQVQIPNYTGSDKFFLVGASKPGGPLDITTGALDSQGHVSLDSALTDWTDTGGNPITNLSLFQDTAGKLTKFGTLGVSTSSFGDVTWLKKNTGTFTDTDGDKYTVKLSGPGAVAVALDNPDAQNHGPIGDLILQGTSPTKSTVTVTVTKGSLGNGLVGIGRVEGSGASTFTARQSDLTGDGIALTGTNYFGSITLHDIADNASIFVPGTGGTGVSITANLIGSGANIQVAGVLKNLTAARIAGAEISAGSITAITTQKGALNANITATRGIGTITVNGTTSSSGLSGNITANGTAGIGTVTSNKGGLSNATITASNAIGAGIKTLTVNGAVTNSAVTSQGTGGIGTMTLKGNANLNVTVPNGKVGTFTMAGTALNPLQLSGAWDVLGIKTMTTTFTNFFNCTIDATSIGTLQAGGNLTGTSSITAWAAGSIKVLGDLASTSTYAIDITALSTTSKIEIAGTGTYGAGAGFTYNRIRVGTLNGQILIGTGAKVLNGMFGCVYVTDSLSTGKLKADAANPDGWLYADNPNNLTYTVGTTTGKAVGMLFGHSG